VVRASGSFKLASGALQIGFIIIIVSAIYDVFIIIIIINI